MAVESGHGVSITPRVIFLSSRDAAMSSIARTERLDLRVSADLKDLIEKAAALSGQTVSSFVLGATTQRAREVVSEVEVIQLSDRDRDRLLAALDDRKARPGAALKKAARRYRSLLG
jgi:uncharacterized protein (DUF1778 family)